MKKKSDVLLIIACVATLLAAIIGTTLAFFSASSTTTKQNVKTGILKVTASTGQVTGANIKPVNSYDVDDYASLNSNDDVVKLPITVTTTGTTIDAIYNMYLSTDGLTLNSDSNLIGGSLSDIKWTLYDNQNTTQVIGTGNLGNGKDKQVITKLPIKITPEKLSTTKHNDEYTLFIYIENKEEYQNKLQGITINAIVSVEAKQS